MVEVNMGSADEAVQALHGAIQAVQAAAARYHMGIRVSRITPLRYVVRAHPSIPCGLI
jgi:hypothetical protein